MTGIWNRKVPVELTDKLNSILNDHVGREQDSKGKLHGVAAVVSHKDGILYQGSSGFLNFEADSPPYSTDTFTWIASMTKVVTSVSILQLVEKGVVTLDEDIRGHTQYLQSIQIIKGVESNGKPILVDNSKPITLRQLLTHTAGMSYVHDGEPDVMKWAEYTGRKVLVGNNVSLASISTPLIYPPGEGWRYSTGLDWAGQVLEKLTGQTLGAYMQEHIFRPLDMKSTTFKVETLPEAAPRTAAYAQRAEDGTLVEGESPRQGEIEMDGGGGGLYSTADDYAKFLRALLRGDLLSADTMEWLFTPQLDRVTLKALQDQVSGHESDYMCEFDAGTLVTQTLGGFLNLEDVPGKRKAGSLMWSGYANAHWWVDRKMGIAGVITTTLLPPGEPAMAKFYRAFEEALYAGLE